MSFAAVTVALAVVATQGFPTPTLLLAPLLFAVVVSWREGARSLLAMWRLTEWPALVAAALVGHTGSPLAKALFLGWAVLYPFAVGRWGEPDRRRFALTSAAMAVLLLGTWVSVGAAVVLYALRWRLSRR